MHSQSWAPPPPDNWDSVPKPPPEESWDTPPEPPPAPKDGDASNVDLDTRIAMMFNRKSSGTAPAFLQLGSDSEEDKKEDGEVNDEEEKIDAVTSKLDKDLNIDEKSRSKWEVPIKEELEDHVPIKMDLDSDESPCSSVPSPFESTSAYKVHKKYQLARERKLAREKLKVESGASDISSSEDELLAKGSYSPLQPHPSTIKRKKKSKKREDDQMSFSSLSSTEPTKMDDEVVEWYELHNFMEINNNNQNFCILASQKIQQLTFTHQDLNLI